MFIVDAHLDLAYNALRGRDVLRPAAEQTADEEGIPTVGLPDLRAGGRRTDLRDHFCEPSLDGKPGTRRRTRPHDGGHAAARLVRAAGGDEGGFRFVTRPADVPAAPGGRRRPTPRCCCSKGPTRSARRPTCVRGSRRRAGRRSGVEADPLRRRHRRARAAHARGRGAGRARWTRRHDPRRLAPGRGILLATAGSQRRAGDGVALELPGASCRPTASCPTRWPAPRPSAAG